MTAMETQFSWVLGGDSCREEALAELQLQPAMPVMYEEKPLDMTLNEFLGIEEIPHQDEPTITVEVWNG